MEVLTSVEEVFVLEGILKDEYFELLSVAWV